MSASEKVAAVGAPIVGLGGALGVAYYIYSLESGQPFWSWPGVIAVVATVVGLLLLALGVIGRETSQETLTQTGGKRSTNYQAGGDITIRKNDDANR